MDVLAGNRQAWQFGQQVTAHFGQIVRVVAADVEHRARLLGEGVQAHGEQAQLAGRAGGLEQARRVGVEARRGVGVDIAHVLAVARVGSLGVFFVAHLLRRVVAVLQAGEDLLGAVAQLDPQVIDQLQRAVILHLRVERQFGIGRAAAYQGAAGVVADAAEHRGADAGRADHRMRLAIQRRQRLLQAIQGGAGQTDYLLAIVDQLHAGDAQGADQHDLTVVVFAIGGRASGQAGIGRLHDDDAIGRHRGLQDAPLLQQRAGAHHRQDIALAGAMALAKAPCRLFIGQHMAGSNDLAHLRQQGVAAQGGGSGHRLNAPLPAGPR